MDHFIADFREQSLFFAVCLFVFLLSDSIPLFLRIVLIGVYGCIRLHAKSFLLLVALMLCCAFPRTSTEMPQTRIATVTKIRSGYMVVEQRNERFILYTDDPLLFDLDDKVSFVGEVQELQASSGFFKYDFAHNCRRNGIYYAINCTSIEQVEETKSLRGQLMHRAKEKEHASEYLSALFGLRGTSTMFTRFLSESGISVSCVLSFFTLVLKRFLVEKKRNRILLILSFALCIFEHFSFAVTSQLVYRCAGFFLKERKERIGCSMLFLLVLFPHCAVSPAFFIPYAFRFFGLFKSLGKEACMRISWMAQSILFHGFNPFFSIFYRYLMPMYGLYWILTVFEILGFGSALFLGRFIDALLNLLTFAEQRGSVLGVGLILYFLLYRMVQNFPYCETIRTILFLLFFVFGLYHPLGEVTMINVGQGDCILLRAPFNTCNVLIDTGKSSASSAVLDVLDGLGIRTIDHIYISHADEDHRGGLSAIMEHCTVHEVTEGHFEQSESGPFTFYDLNTIESEDTNASSQVLYTSINGLTYLFMGDIDTESEGVLLKYHNLLKTDVLKVAHHGSKTSTSRTFLSRIQPSLALISCGNYELYHHPSPSVLQSLLSMHIPYFKTIEDGDLRILHLSHANIFFTSSGKIAIIRSYDHSA